MSEDKLVKGGLDPSRVDGESPGRKSAEGQGGSSVVLRMADGTRKTARLLRSSDQAAEVELPATEVLPALGERLLLEWDEGEQKLSRPAEVASLDASGRPLFRADFIASPKEEDSAPPFNISRIKVNPKVALKLPAARARQWQILPFSTTDDAVLVASADPLLPKAEALLSRAFRSRIELFLVDGEALNRVIERVYAPAETLNITDVQNDDELDAVALYDLVFASALMYEASDIHIDSFRDVVRIRVRVDGQIESLRELSPENGASLISRIKVMAGLDISERRAPQDGRLQIALDDRVNVDVRVATLPTKHGERVTLRLLGKDAEDLSLDALGMSPAQLEKFGQAIRQPYGLILITGPTGSGKSTTLFAAIQRLISETDMNVITIEDPIEYQIPGVTQVEVDPAEKVTFAKALRSTLRHDPDVVMIGEIRDAETADIAVKAALTGHLVLSTLHTNDAAGAITRLLDMGVPSYLVSATLRSVIAQRLVRRLCSACAAPVSCDPAHAEALGRVDLTDQQIKEPVGCMFCGDRGYVGRLALFEMLTCDRQLAKLISENASEDEIRSHLEHQKEGTLADDAAQKLLNGQTSMSDVLRNVVSFADLAGPDDRASGAPRSNPVNSPETH
ncbi:MAG: GspE/PulE family protein [Pseudomonadota bacterium]